MPIFKLTDKLLFPDPDFAESDGLLAIGGDFTHERLLLAYESGIFPWPYHGYDLLWFSPNPRSIIIPSQFKISKSLAKTIRQGTYEVRFDTNFNAVIENCSLSPRNDQNGTWITESIIAAYIKLHELGYAHSVESYYNGELAGGLYGVSIGNAFFGESMFYLKTDASKVAFYTLAKRLTAWGFHFIDNQLSNPHLEQFGSILISREDYLIKLAESNKYPTKKTLWTKL